VFSAPGAEAVQAGVRDVRLLPVLFGLLLIADAACRGGTLADAARDAQISKNAQAQEDKPWH
jgi:hypothetical protein